MEELTLFERIKELATIKGKTIKAVEQDLGLAEGHIRKWKVFMPNSKALVMIADYFGVSVDYLLGREPIEDENINAMLSNPEYRALFKKTAKMSKQDLEFVKRLIESINTDE